MVEQPQYWKKKANYSPVRNLAAINAEDQIFEISSPNVFVVDSQDLEKQRSGKLKQISPKSVRSDEKSFMKFPRNSLQMSKITEFGKTLFSGGQDTKDSLKQTFTGEAILEDVSAIDRQSKEEPPQRLKPTYNLN